MAIPLFIYITAALNLYPIIAWLIFRLTKSHPVVRKRIVWILCGISFPIMFAMIVHIITISQDLNWLLLTFNYLTISVLLGLTQHQPNKIVDAIGGIVIFILFGAGCLISTLGFFFVFVLSVEATADKKWISKDLIFMERKIGFGFDPDERLTEVEVYGTIVWFPALAARIEKKTYDDWFMPKQRNLNTTLSKDNQFLYLKSHVEGAKVWDWADTIKLSKK